ncbi:MAG: G2/M-phase specific E3 ubiquitin protein ligase [Marteilia pararefringens]
MAVFFNMLDTATFNSFLLYKAKNPEFLVAYKNQARREYIKILCEQLMNIDDFVKIKEAPKKKKENERGRCTLCSGGIRKKSRISCDFCQNYICEDHRKKFDVYLNKYRHNDDQDGSHSQNEQIDQAEAGQTVEDWRIGECLRIRIAPGDLLDEDTDESREKNRISVARILQLNIAFSVMQQLIERNKNPAPDCQPFNSSKPSNTIHNRKQSKFNATQKSQTVEYYSKILQERVKTPWMSKIIPRIMTENELESISLDMHYYCILLSSGLAQNGEEDEGLRGFLLPDIYREMRRGTHLKCKFCQHPGATIGCCVKSCSVKFHYPCGLSNQCLFQFFDHFL